MTQQDASTKKLYRSRRDRVIAGVCGGVAEYFNIDPVWVRIVWVLSIFIKGVGLLGYLICWILIPEREWSPSEAGTAAAGEPSGTAAGEGGTAGTSETAAKGKGFSLSTSEPRVIIGIVLIALGVIFGILSFVPLMNDKAFWAVVMIVLGLALIAKR